MPSTKYPLNNTLMAGPDSPMTSGWWGHGLDGIPKLLAQGLPPSRIVVSVNWAAKRYSCDSDAFSPTHCAFAPPKPHVEAFDNLYLFEVEEMLADGSWEGHMYE